MSSDPPPVNWFDTADRPLSSLILIVHGDHNRRVSVLISRLIPSACCTGTVPGTSVKNMQFYGAVPRHDLTYSDVFLVPSQSAISSRLDVSLAPGDGTAATIPIVSANMNSVTGPRLAASLARRGGLGVLP